MARTVLVTGSSGFIASHLMAQLLEPALQGTRPAASFSFTIAPGISYRTAEQTLTGQYRSWERGRKELARQ